MEYTYEYSITVSWIKSRRKNNRLAFLLRNLLDVLHDSNHYEFFKRFMMSNDITQPLLLWKYVEDLKEAKSTRVINNLISTIYRKFFSSSTKQGLMYIIHFYCLKWRRYEDVFIEIKSYSPRAQSILIKSISVRSTR